MASKGIYIPKPYAKKRYYTRADIERYSKGTADCWVSLFGKVYDLAPLLEKYLNDPLSVPLIEAAGTDITHWFDSITLDPRTYVSPYTNLREVYCPQGRFIHVPPETPDPGFDTNVKTPWWKDPSYCIGRLSTRTMQIYICNLLSKQTVLMEVPCEETLNEIQDRYLEIHNVHAKSYTWKRLGRPLDMTKTLEDNGIPDEKSEFLDLDLDADDHIITLHLYFKDDLTEA